MFSGHPEPDPIGEGQESVWNYPRPAIAEPTHRHIVIRHRGHIVADTNKAWRTLETSHPPTYYLPPADVTTEFLVPNARRSLCEWKGQARYWDVVLGEERIEAACWSYADPAADSPQLQAITPSIRPPSRHALWTEKKCARNLAAFTAAGLPVGKPAPSKAFQVADTGKT